MVGSYNDYGDGDVIFKIQTPIQQCPGGYWLTKSDAGFSADLSLILSAYQAKNDVIVYGLPSQIWSGSSTNYCKLYSIRLL